MAGKKSVPPGRVRIIGGRWRGRRVPVASRADIRPTPDRVRETLFNWLMPVIEGARCLDLFAGTGALGLEALSRGAALAWFVDNDARVTATIGQVLEDLQCGDATVVTSDSQRFLKGEPVQFDIVFLDPPFAGIDLGNLCKLLEPAWLCPGSHVYLELSKRGEFPSLPDGWEILRDKTAGEVRFALARRS